MPTDPQALKLAHELVRLSPPGCRKRVVAEALIRREEGVAPITRETFVRCGVCDVALVAEYMQDGYRKYHHYCHAEGCGTRIKWPAKGTK